jgi:trigger factor
MGQPFTRQQFDSIRDRMTADAETKVRAGLLMAAIARKHEMKVTEEDIENGLQELAQETGKNVAKLKAEYREKQKRDILIGMILEDKILTFVEGKSKITEVTAETKSEGSASEEGAGEKAAANKTGKKTKKTEKDEK